MKHFSKQAKFFAQKTNYQTSCNAADRILTERTFAIWRARLIERKYEQQQKQRILVVVKLVVYH